MSRRTAVDRGGARAAGISTPPTARAGKGDPRASMDPEAILTTMQATGATFDDLWRDTEKLMDRRTLVDAYLSLGNPKTSLSLEARRELFLDEGLAALGFSSLKEGLQFLQRASAVRYALGVFSGYFSDGRPDTCLIVAGALAALEAKWAGHGPYDKYSLVTYLYTKSGRWLGERVLEEWRPRADPDHDDRLDDYPNDPEAPASIEPGYVKTIYKGLLAGMLNEDSRPDAEYEDEVRKTFKNAKLVGQLDTQSRDGKYLYPPEERARWWEINKKFDDPAWPR